MNSANKSFRVSLPYSHALMSMALLQTLDYSDDHLRVQHYGWAAAHVATPSAMQNSDPGTSCRVNLTLCSVTSLASRPWLILWDFCYLTSRSYFAFMHLMINGRDLCTNCAQTVPGEPSPTLVFLVRLVCVLVPWPTAPEATQEQGHVCRNINSRSLSPTPGSSCGTPVPAARSSPAAWTAPPRRRCPG